MANLTETAVYEAGIYRFETTDPVQGGPGGIDNLPTNQLANRTAWLKAQVEAILLDIAAIEAGYATAASLASHASSTANPHGVTKAQVGLGSVENYGLATQAEAQAGTVGTKYMTPLRTKEAIAALVPAASETAAGLIERATAAEAQGLADALRAITPGTLTAALQGSNQQLGANGYQRLPGGLILQWGTGAGVPDEVSGSSPVFGYFADIPIVYPVAFPTALVALVESPRDSSATELAIASKDATKSGFTAIINAAQSGTSIGFYWIAIGY